MPSKKIKILLVDSNQDHAQLIIKSLQESIKQILVYPIQSIDQSDFFLKKHPINALLVDIENTDLKHLPFLKSISERYSRIPIIVITGEADEKFAAKCIKAGAEEFILKTRESLKTLPSTLMECIQKRKKKKISLLPDRNKKVINSVFHEIESISKTMKSVYQKIGEQSSYYGEKIGDLRKIAIIDHQMENLKDVLRKLFSRVSK